MVTCERAYNWQTTRLHLIYLSAVGDGRRGVRPRRDRSPARRQGPDGEGPRRDEAGEQHEHQDLLQEFPHPPQHARGGHRLGAL